jgi:hypothetical protein
MVRGLKGHLFPLPLNNTSLITHYRKPLYIYEVKTTYHRLHLAPSSSFFLFFHSNRSEFDFLSYRFFAEFG